MDATKLRMLLTLLATLSGAATQIPGLPPLAILVAASLASFLTGWAHMSRPGDAAKEGAS